MTPATGDIAARLSGDATARFFPGPGGRPIDGDFRLITKSRTTVASAFSMLEDRAFQPFQEEDPLATGINIVDEFNADNTGATNSTTALVNAYSGTVVGDTLFFPPGTYVVDPDVLVITNRRLIGSGVSSGATLKASGAGTSILKASATCLIDGLRFDCNNVCERGLWAYQLLGGTVANVSVVKAAGYGILAFESSALFASCSVSAGDSGFKVVGCNASAFLRCQATSNQKIGLEVWGGAYAGAGSSLSGQCEFIACVLDLNGLDTTSPAARIWGVENFSIVGGYVESGAGVEISEDTHNSLISIPNINTSASVACLILGKVQACQFIGNHGSTNATQGRIYCNDPANFRENMFFGNHQTSRIAPAPMNVVLDNGGTPYTFTPSGGVLHATAAPTLGVWRKSDRIWNNNAGSSPMGWYCSVAGTPGTWLAFG